MISYIRGTLQSRDISGGPADTVVIEVAGVGFEVTCSPRTALSLGELGAEVNVHTSLTIRENDWTIFGFASREEREIFALLQSVSGIGPKLALALVGTLGPEQLAEAVVTDDPKLLSQAPGVGSKVAQRIILELKPKMEEWHRRQGGQVATAKARNRFLEEARAVLEGLGYTPTEINLAFKQVPGEEGEDDVEMLVRHSLKILGASGR